MVCLKYFTADIRCFYIQLYIIIVEALLGYLLQLIKSVFPIARLMTSGLRHTSHPFEFRTIQIIGAFYLYGFGFDTLFTLFQIITIIALVLIYPTVVYFNNIRTDTVKKVPVVCHHQQGKVGTTQIVFQPFGHVKIQVIGGFIQYQKIGFGDKCIGKRYAFQLSAGK